MQFKRILVTLLFLNITIIGFTQKINIFKLQDDVNFIEVNQFQTYDSSIIISQEVRYTPGIPDSNRTYTTLSLYLSHIPRKKKVIDVSDSSIIQPAFYLNDNIVTDVSITGKLILVNWLSSRAAIVNLGITVIDNSQHKTYTYFGTRNFKKSNIKATRTND